MSYIPAKLIQNRIDSVKGILESVANSNIRDAAEHFINNINKELAAITEIAEGIDLTHQSFPISFNDSSFPEKRIPQPSGVVAVPNLTELENKAREDGDERLLSLIEYTKALINIINGADTNIKPENECLNIQLDADDPDPVKTINDIMEEMYRYFSQGDSKEVIMTKMMDYQKDVSMNHDGKDKS